jgi:FixJ family two-component response regulator
MPHMSGTELARRLRERRPETRVLFTSGYTENAIVHHGVLDPTLAFLQKPYVLETLLGKVRSVLDTPVEQNVEAGRSAREQETRLER